MAHTPSRMRRHTCLSGRIRSVLTAAILALGTACIPYSVGSTAQTVPVGQRRENATLWFMPNGIGLRDDSLSKPHTFSGVDAELRWGVTSSSDFGLRVTSGSGLVATYKRRMLGAADTDAAALSWQLGAGFVNLGDHVIGEVSVLASGPKRGNTVVYGGLRAMQTGPLSAGAVKDKPTAGGLIGARITVGGEDIVPEIAVYHDPSALGIRRSDVIFVPSVTIPGSLFERLIRLIPSRR